MRQVIILEREPDQEGVLRVRYALWAAVPSARQPFWASKQGSAFSSAVKDGSVTAGELAALQAGAVVESVVESRWPPNTTLAQAEALLQAAWTDYQAFVNNYNPWRNYGSSWDGSGWTMKAVA